MDVALVSCETLPEPDPDAAPLTSAFAARGLTAAVHAWEDPRVDWSKAPITLLRSCWNYPLHHEAFLDWAEGVARATSLWNPLDVVRWNSHKSYLLDLERAGVPVVPTVLASRGSSRPLQEVLGERDWDDLVVKPAVGAWSLGTRRFGRSNVARGDAHLRELTARGDVLVQQYQPSVEDHGERCVIWIDGAVTHAVRKAVRFDGDEESISFDAVPVSAAEAEVAEAAVASASGPLLYARIDLVPGRDGTPLVMELELIEPSLFLRQGPAAAEVLAAAVERRLA